MGFKYIQQFQRVKGSLIPLLQRTQQEFSYLPKDALRQISEYLGVPITRVYGVATFYAQFRFEPAGKHVVKICHGTSCHVNGAVGISEAIEDEVGVGEGETTSDALMSLERVACLGCCSLSPCIMVNGNVFGKLTTERARRIVQKIRSGGDS